jgi:hypothetical protein
MDRGHLDQPVSEAAAPNGCENPERQREQTRDGQ